jgi:hypothetical protein
VVQFLPVGGREGGHGRRGAKDPLTSNVNLIGFAYWAAALYPLGNRKY